MISRPPKYWEINVPWSQTNFPDSQIPQINLCLKISLHTWQTNAKPKREILPLHSHSWHENYTQVKSPAVKYFQLTHFGTSHTVGALWYYLIVKIGNVVRKLACAIVLGMRCYTKKCASSASIVTLYPQSIAFVCLNITYLCVGIASLISVMYTYGILHLCHFMVFCSCDCWCLLLRTLTQATSNVQMQAIYYSWIPEWHVPSSHYNRWSVCSFNKYFVNSSHTK